MLQEIYQYLGNVVSGMNSNSYLFAALPPCLNFEGLIDKQEIMQQMNVFVKDYIHEHAA